MNINELEFFTQLLKTNSQNNGSCIEWTGKLAGGYGYIYAYKKSWTTHRIAFLLQNGYLPDDLYICHKCNNKKCINPDHLYAGTAKQNAQDLKNSDYYPDVKQKMKDGADRYKVYAEEYRKRAEEYMKSFLSIGIDDLKLLIKIEVEKHFEIFKSEYLNKKD